MASTFQIGVCGTRTLSEDEFSALTQTLDDRFKGTVLEGSEYHLSHYDWGPNEKFSGHINVNIISPSKEEGAVWHKLSNWEGQSRQFNRGLRNMGHGLSATPPEYITTLPQRLQSIKYGFGQAVDAITSNSNKEDYEFQKSLAKDAFAGTELEGVRIQTASQMGLSPEYTESYMAKQGGLRRSHHPAMFIFDVRPPS